MVHELASTSFTPSKALASASVRASFAAWIIRNRNELRGLTVAEMVHRAEIPISLAAAYRCAVALGLRGRRYNRTRYATFWAGLNWALPDMMLSTIWGVDRGNLRRRRQRLHRGSPVFDEFRDRSTTTYVRALKREERKAQSYNGPRPC